MPTFLEVIVQYLGDSVAAERSLETQFRSSAKDGDDGDVQAYFLTAADRAAAQADLLTNRLFSLNATEHRGKHLLADLLAAVPKAAQLVHSPEERIVQNLMKGFALSKSASAMYVALEHAARVAEDEQTAILANRLAAEEERGAEGFWHFLPSRSKIAYNVVTAGEVDPSVETRAPDDRVTESLS